MHETHALADRRIDGYFAYRRCGGLYATSGARKGQRNHIALLGWSHGAQTLLAATDKNHPSVIAAGQPVKTAIAFYPGCVEAALAGYRPNAQLTLLLCAEDNWMLPEPCIKLGEGLKAQGADMTVKVYAGAMEL